MSSEYRGSLRRPRRGNRPVMDLEASPALRGFSGAGCSGGSPRSRLRGLAVSRPPARAGRRPLSPWGAPSPPLRAARPRGPGRRPGPGSACGSSSRSAWRSGPGPGARPGCAPSRHRGSALRPARTCLPGSRLHPPRRAPPPLCPSRSVRALAHAHWPGARSPSRRADPPRAAGRRVSPRGGSGARRPHPAFRPRWVLAPRLPLYPPTPSFLGQSPQGGENEVRQDSGESERVTWFILLALRDQIVPDCPSLSSWGGACVYLKEGNIKALQ